MLYAAKAGVVHSYEYVEFDIDLGFGVRINKPLKLKLGIPKIKDRELLEKAKRCMIVLLGGGKKVILDVDEREVFTYVYCLRKINSEFAVSVGGETAMDVTKVMQFAYSNDFDTDTVVENVLKVREE